MSRKGKKKAKSRNTEELLAVAAQSAREVPEPTKRVSMPAPTPDPETSFRIRRYKPLNNATLPPLTWLDALDKYCPLPPQKA